MFFLICLYKPVSYTHLDVYKRQKLDIAVLDKESDAGWGTTKANSGIIHPGYAGEMCIRDRYHESELVSKAKKLIFESYMKEIKALIEDGRYKEALDEYRLAQNIALKNNTDVSANIYDESIYSKIPPDILSEYAISLTLDKKYEDAIHVFDYIFINYPDSSEKIAGY